MSESDNVNIKPNILLKDGIKLQDVSKGLVSFETDTEFLNTLEKEDEDVSDGEEESIYFAQEDHKECKQSYMKLWTQMTAVGDGKLIRKSIIKNGTGDAIKSNTIVKAHLSGFIEGCNEPFTTTPENQTMVMHVDNGGHLPGLDLALKSMNVGEYSRFLISHELMYGDLGCPPLIPAKARCLVYISAVTVEATLPTRNDTPVDQTYFQVVYDKAVALHLNGKTFFQKTEYNYAIKSFKSAIHLLEFCRLADEKEEFKQQKFLAKLFLNLAICYNKMKLPLKACSMCNELNRMDKLYQNPKALLHNARALLMLGEYNQANKLLLRGCHLDPGCQELKNELKILAEKKERSLVYEENLRKHQKHFNHSESDIISQDFINSADEFCKSVVEDNSTYKAALPSELTLFESKTVEKLASKYNLYCKLEKGIVTAISKMRIDKQVSDEE